MKGISAHGERIVRIELARARAAVERQRLARGVRDVSQELAPARLMAHLFPRLGHGSGLLPWLRGGVELARRYPFLVSAASAACSGLGKRRRWWRLGVAALAGIEAARVLSRRRDSRQGKAHSPN